MQWLLTGCHVNHFALLASSWDPFRGILKFRNQKLQAATSREQRTWWTNFLTNKSWIRHEIGEVLLCYNWNLYDFNRTCVLHQITSPKKMQNLQTVLFVDSLVFWCTITHDAQLHGSQKKSALLSLLCFLLVLLSLTYGGYYCRTELWFLGPTHTVINIYHSFKEVRFTTGILQHVLWYIKMKFLSVEIKEALAQI